MAFIDFLGPISTLIDKVLPDANARIAAKEKLAELQQQGELEEFKGELQLAMGQQAINLEESKSASLFKSGWRPAIGWVGAVALFTYYVPYTLVATYIWAAQVYQSHQLVARPDLGITDLLGLLGTLLGFGVLRSHDKLQGTA